MKTALSEANKAAKKGEVPIGAVIVDSSGSILAKAHNLRESKNDATAHAEILAIKKACRKLNNWRLSGCTIYITLQPCEMCLGAIRNARIEKIVYGAKADKFDLNHNLLSEYQENADCENILRDFFKGRRNAIG